MLMKLSPLEDMDLLKKQIDNVFEPLRLNGTSRLSRFAPPIEVTEQGTRYSVRLIIPGIDPKQIQLDATAKQLHIAGEIQPRELEKDETVHLSEFNYGPYSRTLSFPHEIDVTQIEATYRQGILEIRLPKAEAAQRKQIPIKVEQ